MSVPVDMCVQTDRQTDSQAQHNTLFPYRGEVITATVLDYMP